MLKDALQKFSSYIRALNDEGKLLGVLSGWRRASILFIQDILVTLNTNIRDWHKIVTTDLRKGYMNVYPNSTSNR